MADDTVVELWGGGVLVFDQFGRFRLHQRQPIFDSRRQTARLASLFRRGLPTVAGGPAAGAPFRRLHGDGSPPDPPSSPSAEAVERALALLAEPDAMGAAAWLIRGLNGDGGAPAGIPEQS